MKNNNISRRQALKLIGISPIAASVLASSTVATTDSFASTDKQVKIVIVGGGTGAMYSADNVYILGRQQEKEGTEIVGYNFIINVEKSRYVKEKSKIPVSVSFDGGLSKWSGLLDVALESGHVIKPSNGWYQKVNKETGEIDDKKYRIKDTDSKEFWLPILTSKSFYDFIKNKYSIGQGEVMMRDELDTALEALEFDE